MTSAATWEHQSSIDAGGAAVGYRRSSARRLPIVGPVTTTEQMLVGLLMVVGLIGVAVPILPGLLLVLVAALWWTIGDGGGALRWTLLGLIGAVFVVGTVLKYVVPAKRTSAAGAAGRSMVIAVVLGVLGMFVIPIVGAPVGFVLGIYLSEAQRLRSPAAAWAATKVAVKGVALSMLIEFLAGVLMFAIWLVGVFVS
jgi:uncharacterized protein YqgC (DUF456 family)